MSKQQLDALMWKIESNAALAWTARQYGHHKTAAVFAAEVARLNQIRFK